MIPKEERRKRLTAVQNALLMLSDGRAYSSRELFDREGAQGEQPVWQGKAMIKMADLGLVTRLGSSRGPGRLYQLAEGRAIEEWLEDERAALILWDTGILSLNAPDKEEEEERFDLPEELFENTVGEEPNEMEGLLGKLFTVLESFDARLKVLEERSAPETAEDVAEAVAFKVATYTHHIEEQIDSLASNQKILGTNQEELRKQLIASAKETLNGVQGMCKSVVTTTEEMSAEYAAAMLRVLKLITGEPEATASARPTALTMVLANEKNGPAHFKKGPRT